MAGLAENDIVSTIGYKGKRIWLYPRWQRGRFLTARTLVHWALLAVFLVGPWIEVRGHPAIQIDIPGRRIYFWGLTLFATDGYFFLFFFGFLVFGVFLFTALFGRAWCGWTCPQTVFLESVIRPVERLFEGPPSKQKKLDKAPWSAGKVARKLGKWGAFLAFAGILGTTFVAYFRGADGVIAAQFDPFGDPAATISFAFITGLTFFDFVYFREQTCIVVCPYGRFQSVLLDDNSLMVGYDERRGEPRGKPSREGVGDCVDCKACVQVCPTGIDIRKGSQMECVQCMACVDACDAIMDKLERPRGLISLTSQNRLDGARQQILRGRVVVYALGLLVVFGAFGLTVSRREDVEVNLTRQQVAPWAQMPDGRVQNGLRLRIQNKSDEDRAFTVRVVEPATGQMLAPLSPLTVLSNRTEHMPVFLILPAEAARDNVQFVLEVADGQEFRREIEVEFLAKPTGGG